MTYVLPLLSVAEALYGVFRDSTLQALVPGGVHTDVPEDPSYPFLWFELVEDQQFGGLGTKPGGRTLPELELRLHAVSQFQGMAECQAIIGRAVALLTDPPLVAGHSSWAIFHDRTLKLSGELNGVKVQELVSLHRWYVEAVP